MMLVDIIQYSVVLYTTSIFTHLLREVTLILQISDLSYSGMWTFSAGLPVEFAAQK